MYSISNLDDYVIILEHGYRSLMILREKDKKQLLEIAAQVFETPVERYGLMEVVLMGQLMTQVI